MGYVTSLFARKMIAAAGDQVDQRSLLALVGLEQDTETDPKLMLVDSDYYDLLERISEQVDVTDLPLKAAKLLGPDDYGALGLAWKAAPTLMGSFSRVERYARLWTSVVEYELRTTERGMLFILHRSGARRLGLRLSNEATLASAVSLSRQVSPEPFAPIEVQIKHSAPRSVDYHRAYFGCPVHFDSEFDALLISPDALARSNKLGDEGITKFLLSHLDAELDQFKDDNSLESQAKKAIARSLSEGLPKMADIARGMGMSARTFHRRLAVHGLNFQTITKSTQRELAEGLLRQDRYSLAEIAFLTGFAEQSSFTRAFKRWVGLTPANYRKKISPV